MYKFNNNSLQFVKIHWTYIWTKILGGYLVILLFIFGGMPLIKYAQIEREVKIIIADRSRFTEDKLVDIIKGLHFSFPYIVMAQAIHESGNYTSKLFLENNNMFGMKLATVRLTTSNGDQNGYAYYNTWIECVYDRALYSATYLSNVKTEDEYYNFLSQYYAEDKEYVNKLKKIIDQHGLKKLFNIN